MANSAQKDDMLNLLATRYSVTASQTVIAQWNMNNYSRPKIYGYFNSSTSGTAPTNYYVTSTNSYSNTYTSTTSASIDYFSTTFNSTLGANIVRIMFDARISGVTNLSSNVSDFTIMIYPYASGVLQDEFISSVEISLKENVYERQEIFYCSNANSTENFDQLRIYAYPTNDVTNGSLKLDIKNINISLMHQLEMLLNQHDRLAWVFETNKPGDQLLENSLITSNVDPVTKYYVVSDIMTDRIKSPDLIPAYLNPYNENIYYLTPKNDNTYKNIYVEYDTAALCNQIYIKSQDIGATIAGRFITARNTQLKVYLKTGGAWGGSPIYTETSGSFITNGAIVLQYNGSTWSSGYDYTTLPTMASDGTITNTISIEGIRIELAGSDQSHSRIVEVSPRLGVNLSNFLISSEYSNSLDEGNYAVPVGLSGANDASIVLDNVPRYYGGIDTGPVYQVFDNNSYSSLNGLITSDVKFTLYTTITDTETSSQSATIKNFTMYSNKWTSDDLSTVTVALNDYAKYLQSKDAPDFLLMSNYHSFKIGTLQQAVETLLQLAGFSDYDINSLSTVSERLKQKVGTRIPIFYASKEKKVWDALSQLLLGYQVSCFFDENGILQFRDILRESASGTFYANSSSYFNLANTNVSNYLPNIVSCTIDKKDSVGNVTVNYKQMLESNNTISVNGTTVDNTAVNFNSRITTMPTNSKTKPWEIQNEPSGLICVNITSDFLKSDQVIVTGDYTTAQSTRTNAGKPRFITSFKGYGIIEGEVISWDGVEYYFSPKISGFPIREIIKSSDELTDAVSRRISSLSSRISVQSMTAQSLSSSKRVFKVVASGHGYYENDIVQMNIYNSLNKLIWVESSKVYSVASSSFNIALNDSITSLITDGIGADTSVIKDISKITYTSTGRLMNVKRGLFGTNVADHYSTTVSDKNAFRGFQLNNAAIGPQYMRTNIRLQPEHEIDNGTSFPLGTTKGYTTYFGSLKNDSPYYEEYKFVFTPQNDLDNFGIFLGASVTKVSSSARFTATNFGKFGDGIFIEFFPNNDPGNYGAIIRKTSGRRLNEADVIYYSNDKLMLDAYKPSEWKYIYKKDSKGEFVLDDKGDKILIKKYLQKYPPLQQKIEVSVNCSESRTRAGGGYITVKVNNRVMKFYLKGSTVKQAQARIKVDGSFSRTGRSFGVFLRNDTMKNSKININEIQARAYKQLMDQQISWSEAGNPDSSDLNSLINNNVGLNIINDAKRRNGFVHATRPYSLRAEPILKGIAIFDLKWSGDKPFFDFNTLGPYGINGTQNFDEHAIQASRVIATPFRGRVAYRNTVDEIAPLKGSSDSFIPAQISGKSIGDTGERKIKRTISGKTGLENIEITIPWINSEGTAQKVISDITTNINEMNTIFQVDLFGNPALSIGDYVKLTYTEKNISSSVVVVSKINTSFSNGGIDTTATLRRANLSN